MKKILALLAVLCALSAQAQISYTNVQLTAGNITNITTARWVISEITVSADATGICPVTLYDTQYSTNKYTNAAYSSVIGFYTTNTTTWTNTTGLITTNYDVGMKYYTTNYAQSVQTLPAIWSFTAPAGSTTTLPVDLVTVRGLTSQTTNGCTLIFKYRPWSSVSVP